MASRIQGRDPEFKRRLSQAAHGAFTSFAADADQLYPGWRDTLDI